MRRQGRREVIVGDRDRRAAQPVQRKRGGLQRRSASAQRDGREALNSAPQRAASRPYALAPFRARRAAERLGSPVVPRGNTPTPNPTRGINDTKLAFDVGEDRDGDDPLRRGAAGASLEISDLAIDSVKRQGTCVRGDRSPARPARGETATPVDIAYAKPTGTAARRPRLHVDLAVLLREPVPLPSNRRRHGVLPRHPSAGGPDRGVSAAIPSTRRLTRSRGHRRLRRLPLRRPPPARARVVPPSELAAQAGRAPARSVVRDHDRPVSIRPKVGSVSVGAPARTAGWSITALARQDRIANEVRTSRIAHGWFGDRIIRAGRLRTLRGTVSYLAGRARSSHRRWRRRGELRRPVRHRRRAGVAAELRHRGFRRITCSRTRRTCGAMFMRGRGQGRRRPRLISRRSTPTRRRPRRDGDMLRTIETVTGYDPAACAHAWLDDATAVPAVGPCP
jgi:hypothetical protein